ncbi:MAG TPA: protein-L-isoaspartate(D-aspartate) O-methyltransferase [Gammaproteobacteria bacterium]|nr:protein-L-isoaspartate(D-aspartate) O-methyltransferase [Gammaproteobacteria bacterium]
MYWEKRALLLTLLMLCSLARAVDYAAMRQQMIREIESDVRETSIYLDKRALDPRVMAVMAQLPRHLFVPEQQRPHAYENRPLGIGHGQTISQPYIVALMSDLLRVEPGHRVLELGTGSGYQAAVLAQLGAEVYTIEIIEPLGKQAAERFAMLGYRNIASRIGDGYYGWESQAPFDAIMVTAAADHVPAPLIGQLKPGGRMVIPIGGGFQVQQLMLIEKLKDGGIKTRQLLPVRFVPLTGSH